MEIAVLRVTTAQCNAMVSRLLRACLLPPGINLPISRAKKLQDQAEPQAELRASLATGCIDEMRRKIKIHFVN